jgi:hypothetical protein
LINPSNLKPAERLDEIMRLSQEYGVVFIISFFLNELAGNTSHAHFDDKCYWKDVEEEFRIRFRNGKI